MFQIFPHYGLQAEDLRVRQRWRMKKVTASTVYFNGFLWSIPNIYPYTFDANLRAIKGSLVHIARTAASERHRTNTQEARRDCVRRREYPPGATYAPELVETFPETGGRSIKSIESLC